MLTHTDLKKLKSISSYIVVVETKSSYLFCEFLSCSTLAVELPMAFYIPLLVSVHDCEMRTKEA